MKHKLWHLGLALAAILAAAPAAQAESDPNTVTCAYPVWVGFGPVHLANELGYFKDEGITVKEILDDDMPNAMAAMERGDIDCYLRTVGEYQGLGRRKETQGIIIGTIDLSTGGDGWVADGAIKSVCDLKEKAVAVEPNLPARLILQMALKSKCDLTIKDVTMSDIAAADAIGVFSDKSIAAVGTYEPVLSQVVTAHADRGAHLLATSRDYDDLIMDIVMAHTDELKKHPDKYVKLMRGIYRAIDYFNQNRDAAVPIIAKHFSITPEDFTATIPMFRYTPFDESMTLMGTAAEKGRLYEVFNQTMQFNLQFGSSDVELFPDDHIDPSIMAKVKEGWKP